MKKFLLLLFIAVTSLFSAQIQKHVTIKYDVKSLPNNEYEAVITANIDKGWHIYSKDIDPESGAIPTELKLNSKDIQLIGKPVETGSRKTEFSEAFGADLTFLSGTSTFKQKFKVKNPEKPTTVSAEFTYQTCNDKVCLAPETIEFEKKIEGSALAKTEEKTKENSNKDSVESATSVASATANPSISTKQEGLKVASLDFENPLTDCGVSKEKKSENYLTYLFLGFLGGLIALLTPCVFPMIPLTVSFFTKGQKDKAKGKRDAFIYGFFILLIFVLLSVPFHIIDGIAGNIFNQISTSVSLNIAFFLIFLFFAGSFFGYYDITLPSSIANKSSKAEEAGGIIGIFFMALTLVIVSFSCTGPILGSLLGSAVTGSANVPMLLTFALAGFGLSWAIVFGLLALFPQALQSLPKSGGWMNTVKVVLGFVELALALKFLSKADLVSKTFLLKRELFIAIWIIITIGLVLYLFGKIRFPHDDKNQKISVTRKIFGVLGIGFLVYLVQGLVPAERPKLQMLSGILPPINVSYLHDEK
ncbi:cytochrome c biogenesis protein CcdA, partial [Cloacibacterium sp.]